MLSTRLLATLLFVLLLPAAALAQTPGLERSITVVGEGRVSAPPDIAYINAGVTNEGPTAKGVIAANNAVMTKLIGGLKSGGIAPADIQTSAFYMSPHYSQTQDGRGQPVMDGYTATNQLRITVRDIKRAGDILDSVISLGANQMNGISFDIDNPESLEDAARRDAMASAKRRAELYAAAASVQLGQVLQVTENVGQEFHPVMMAASAPRAMMAKDSMAVETGSQMLQVSVQVTYGLR